MKKLYCSLCGKNRKFQKPDLSYILKKTFVISIICRKSKNEDEKIFKEEESAEILRVFGLNENIWLL